MGTVKKIGVVLLIFLLIATISATLAIHHLKPDYSGNKTLQNLGKEVSVYFDTYGIPHIYAETDLDAYRTLGYVHAQDRLWQMELLRRIASGGLSEVFGMDMIGTDKFFLALGIDDASQKTVSLLDTQTEAYKLTQAYLDGINQFIAEGPTPIEFYLTGIQKTPFKVKDVYNTLGYMAFSFAMAHKTDPLLTNIREKLGPEYMADLGVNSTLGTTWIKNYNPNKKDTLGNSMVATVTMALKKLRLPLFEGSNSWVVGPEKTQSGKVLFANDPHIGFAQPSVWYEAHVETPTYSKYGYHLAGIPFPVLGHNRKLAYGMTMFENDDVDFYFEKIDPSDTNKYLDGGEWKNFEEVSRTIKVKDGDHVNFSFKKSSNGPILNGIADHIDGERPIAMWWSYTKMKNRVLDALYELSYADNLSEFESALPKVHAPGLNIMYGDADNNIGWFATAQLYRIPDSVNTKFIFEGRNTLPRERELLDFSENPQAVNPPWHYVYSANNQPDSIAGMLYPGYYLPENRAFRITQLLEPKNDWTKESMKKMIIDVTSPTNVKITHAFADVLDKATLGKKELETLDQLLQWDGSYHLNSVEATIYTRWIYNFLVLTFKDELGEDMFQQFLQTHLAKRAIAQMSKNSTSVWWDDISTPDTKESESVIVQKALQAAMYSLEGDFGKDQEQWTWNKVHSLEHPHPIGQVKALRSFFNVGPFPVEGTREVINNMSFSLDESGFYKTSSGPSTRRIIDFSDIENSISILPTGQSGNPFSEHYRDQAELFVKGEFRKMMMNKEEIQKSSEMLTFSPK